MSKKTKMDHELSGYEHAAIAESKNQLLTGKLDRREFLRTTTLLGLSATAAYTFANLLEGPQIIKSAEAAGKKGGTLRMAMQVQDMSDPAVYDWGAPRKMPHLGDGRLNQARYEAFLPIIIGFSSSQRGLAL